MNRFQNNLHGASGQQPVGADFTSSLPGDFRSPQPQHPQLGTIFDPNSPEAAEFLRIHLGQGQGEISLTEASMLVAHARNREAQHTHADGPISLEKLELMLAQIRKLDLSPLEA